MNRMSYMAQYYEDHKVEINARCRRHYAENRQQVLAKQKEYRESNVERVKARHKNYRRRARQKIRLNYSLARERVLKRLGGKCSRCEFADVRALQIDHVNNDGYKQRQEMSWREYYQMLLNMTDSELKENY